MIERFKQAEHDYRNQRISVAEFEDISRCFHSLKDNLDMCQKEKDIRDKFFTGLSNSAAELCSGSEDQEECVEALQARVFPSNLPGIQKFMKMVKNGIDLDNFVDAGKARVYNSSSVPGSTSNDSKSEVVKGLLGNLGVQGGMGASSTGGARHRRKRRKSSRHRRRRRNRRS